uniref:Protein O-mannosyltransferase 1 n=1 Tax=Drosophila melanogaster TaxID=7227 RepID=POMT1_DROME|nr:rotated abdomen [Drosophila melanogaster]Q9VTK2.2 RecName: Full=Protein O-mannosyltransferase 1; AltName: Full=Dolichyl-phosphate-mannose--protein mannosyltransferase 1; Short=dPOMT1; AltName: Full=Protein rotated abdomen [Drosophila melanogaster]AAF50046.2 rotated abdomen [Drosophila melanogaster]|eukprot:NP_524025.2 rotated abdomen [Drosophila melanogaster]
MSATYTNTITQRRKTAKVRQQQQHQWTGSDLSGESNERLHFRSRSTNSMQQHTAISNSPSPLCCNGARALTMLNCCVDVNCHLNAPLRGSVNRHTTPTPTPTATPTPVATPKQASPSPTSDRSRSLSRSPSPSRSRSLSCQKQIDKNSAGAASAEERKTANASSQPFTVNLRIDLFSWTLFLLAFGTRFYKLATPPHIVFDELHYGKYISMYMRNIFFFDQHPPLGKQLIAGLVSLAGYDGNYTFTRIGEPYSPEMPIFWFRFLPAMCGSLLAPAVYNLLLEAKLSRWSSALGGLLVVLDNSLLTQSRFVLMESMLLLATTVGIACLLRFQRSRLGSLEWFFTGTAAAVCLGAAGTVKYVGFLALGLAFYLLCRHLWQLLYDAGLTDRQLWMHAISRLLIFVGIPLAVYLGVFYIHFKTLHRAGPHDSIMTSAFQASLDGGLASITKGQPLAVVHGSQITLRHTHGRTCWLHSHAAVYPVRYPDKRGSSHQQQVTCYSFKDVNNWWLVKRPTKENLVVGDEPDIIRHGEIIQLVHGITSRALNSHDVAAAMTPQCQEVSCYIDYEIKMAGELLWRVEILNRDSEGDIWHAIKSEVRLVHVSTEASLKFSGRQLPEWGFNQHEVVADREKAIHEDAIWNVEEHRYTQTEDHRERERQMLTAEMIPTKRTRISFWAKLLELQSKMLFQTKSVPNHMYSSMPHEWPLMDKGIAYWLDSQSSAQIYLLGNILLWYTATMGILVYAGLLAFYAMRRQRLCFDISEQEWQRFVLAGDTFFMGYVMHYIPYFCVDRTLFLHNYLPAFVFKLLLLCFVVEHLDYLLRRFCTGRGVHLVRLYRLMLILWLVGVLSIFSKFIPFSYGARKMTLNEVRSLRWKDTWDFVLHKNHHLY